MGRITLVVILGVASFVVVTSTQAERAEPAARCASPPPNDVYPDWAPGGRLAFVRGRGSGALYTLRPHEARLIPLARDAHAITPVWSPDGKSIVWTQPSNPPGIVVARANGERVLSIPNAFDPSWSPDGHALVFVEATSFDDPKQEVRVFDLAARRAITVAHGSEPSWSPDGKRIAYTGAGYGLQAIRVVGADGTGDRLVVGEHPGLYSVALGAPRWRPRTNAIAYIRRDFLGGPTLWLVRADGTGSRELTRQGIGTDLDYRWSPDGRSIAIIMFDKSFYSSIGVLNLRTRRLRVRTVTGRNLFGVAWSRNGRQLAFSASEARGDDGDFERSELWVSDPSLRHLQRLTNHCIVGTRGSDEIRGTPLPDVIRSGDGNDSIRARDERRDVVDCGSGKDTVYADRLDVVRGCEIVRRA